MLVLAFDWQPCINPVLLSFSIVTHVQVTQRRQFTGGFLRSVSGRAAAVDHDVRTLVGQEPGSKS